MLSDQQIISLVAKGRGEVFGDLVARYQKPIFRLACSMTGNRNDAEDATQEVLIRAYKGIGSYSDSGKLWAWLRKITVNVCLKMCKPSRSTPLEELDDPTDSTGDAVFDSVAEALELAELRRLIAQLPPPYRSVIVLKYLEDMSYSEIAEILGESVSNIQVRIFRAKKLLRRGAEVSKR